MKYTSFTNTSFFLGSYDLSIPKSNAFSHVDKKRKFSVNKITVFTQKSEFHKNH